MPQLYGRRIFYRFTDAEREEINTFLERENSPHFNAVHENQEYTGTITAVYGDMVNAVIQCDGEVTKWVTSIEQGYDPSTGLALKGRYQLG